MNKGDLLVLGTYLDPLSAPRDEIIHRRLKINTGDDPTVNIS